MRLAHLVRPDLQDLLELLVKWVPLVGMGLMEKQDHPEHLDCRDHRVWRARKESKVRGETKVSKEKGETLARRVPLATLDLLALLDQRDKEGNKVLPEQLGKMDRLDLLAYRDHQERRETRGHLGHLEPKENLVQPDNQPPSHSADHLHPWISRDSTPARSRVTSYSRRAYLPSSTKLMRFVSSWIPC